MTKTVLVTGGAGFLGSNLCKKLMDLGDKVICIDNMQTGLAANIQKLLNNSNFEYHQIDVTNKYHFDVDQIYNFACPASPPKYQYDPVKTIFTSIFGIINALDLANELKCPILQASTSEVYGNPLVHPQTEDYWGNVNPIGIRSCYDEGKRIAETLMMDYHRKYGTNIKIIRIFNTYGPNMDPNDGRVVSNFINQALKNNPITIYGDGSQTRSFCFVSDLIDGIIKMMNSDSTITGPINLGNPVEFTVKELAQMVIKLTGSKSPIIYQKLPLDDPIKRKPDITKAKQLLNWEPTIDIETGLMSTISYFRCL